MDDELLERRMAARDAAQAPEQAAAHADALGSTASGSTASGSTASGSTALGATALGATALGANASREIVVAARRLFAEFGFQKTNVGDIAAQVGMSPSNLYRYFRNKRAIGEAVVLDFVEEEASIVEEVMARPHASAEARLRSTIEASSGFVVSHLSRSPMLVDLPASLFESAQGAAFVDTLRDRFNDRYEDLVRFGLETGEFRLPPGLDDARAAGNALNHAVAYFHIADNVALHGLERVADDLRKTLDLLCAGLRAR